MPGDLMSTRDQLREEFILAVSNVSPYLQPDEFGNAIEELVSKETHRRSQILIGKSAEEAASLMSAVLRDLKSDLEAGLSIALPTYSVEISDDGSIAVNARAPR